MYPMLVIAAKDLKLLFRDRTSAFFTFGFPLLLAIFFGMVFGGSGGGSPATLAIVDESGGPIAKSFAKDLEDDELIETVHVADRVAGELMVRQGKAIACVILPKSFDAGANAMFTGGGLQVEALVDPARKAETGLLTGKLNEIAFRQLGRAFNDPKRMTSMLTTARAAIAISPNTSAKDKGLFRNFFDSAEKLSKNTTRDPPKDGADASEDTGIFGGFSPAKVTVTELKSRSDAGPNSPYAISFPQGIAWGLMGCVMSFASGLARERSRGTLLRLAVAPVSRLQVLGGKALGCFLACLMVVFLLVLFGRAFLGVTIGNPWLFVLAAIISAFGFSGVMMLLTGLFRSEGGAEGAGRAVILVLAMIGGGTIPLFFMPPFLQTLSSISPFKWAIFAVEGALWRGLTVEQLLPAFGALFAFGIAGLIIGGRGFARSDAR